MVGSIGHIAHRAGAVAVAAVLGLVVGISAPTAADGAENDPTWAQVQAAKSSVAATQAEITTIQQILASAQQEAAATSTAAMTATAAADAAAAELATATARADDLAVQSATADAAARRATTAAATLAATLYRTRTDGPVLARLLTSAAPTDLLSRLSLLDRLGATWQVVLGEATRTAGLASTLRTQADAAQAARAQAADAATATAQAARAAAAADAASVSRTLARQATLIAQLASLKNTSAALEQQYLLAQQVAAQPPQTAPSGGSGSGSSGAGSGSGGSGSTGGAGSGGSGSGSSGGTDYGVVVDPAGAQAYARGAIGAYGWGSDQFSCLVSLWNRESGWRANALNPSSGAYGIPQALPGSKMATAGADWRTNGNTQINWGLAYISARYGSPCGAWAHSQATGWY
ncbi:MAG: hypothetical protein J0H96_10200 [Microbacterium ginsengisoli]|uniref:aggregation-promoting factor C-terminal-like domain-containing protein n=1 Tax=uncultured Microbacterium sp. TaxID=191216 RepID=UPI001AD3BC8E|nr:hypothetical protein [uncultured Microbacterium sp.]MBN9209017.1 hypothetical protein [Microbacterium ginsengisoli]